MCWPAAGRLPRSGELKPDPLIFVKGVRQPVLKVTGVVAGLRRELIYLPTAVAAPLKLELFLSQVGGVVGVLGHDFTRQMGQADLAVRLVAARGLARSADVVYCRRPAGSWGPAGCGPSAAFME
jgi:hypothetical protein